MEARLGPICGEHKTRKEWRETTFEYSEDGITVRVLNIDAWICPGEGETSFTPAIADELHRTARESLDSTKKAIARKLISPPYVVTVELGEQVELAA